MKSATMRTRQLPLFIGMIIAAVFVTGAVGFVIARQLVRTPGQVGSFEECAAAGNPIGESYPRQCFTLDGRHFVETVGMPAAPGLVTLTGEMTCLPKIGSGPQTMECAFGLLADDGRYYGLKYDPTIDPAYELLQGGLRMEVTGELTAEEQTGPDGNRYDTAGLIEVTSIRKLAESSED